VGDSRLRLRGTKGKEGEGKADASVALTVLFGPIGLIKHKVQMPRLHPGPPFGLSARVHERSW
jgi:hypothetical protein